MYRYYVLIILALVYAFSYMDRQIISILMDDIKAEFLLSDTQLGLLSGLAFAIFYATLGLPIARLADRSNRVRIISIAVALWSALTVLTAAAGTFLQLLLVRVGVGVGEAGAGPASHAVLSDYFNPQERPFALSVYSTGVVVGALMGLALGGYIAESYGWRMAFVVAGLPGILLAIVVWVTVREPERAVDLSDIAVDGGAEQLSFWSAVVELWENRVYRYVNLAHLLAVAFGYSASTWIAPLFLRRWDVGQAEVGATVGLILIVGGLPGMLFGGWFATRLSRIDRRWEAWISAVALCLATPLYLAGYSATSMTSASIILAFATFFFQCSHGPGMAVLQNSVNPSRRAFAAAFMFFCSNLLGLGLGPLIVGAISDMGLGATAADSLAIAMSCLVVLLLPAFCFYWLGGLLWGRRLQVMSEEAPGDSPKSD